MFIKAVIELTVLTLPSGMERDDTMCGHAAHRPLCSHSCAYDSRTRHRNQPHAAQAGPPTGTISTQQTKEGEKALI